MIEKIYQTTQKIKSIFVKVYSPVNSGEVFKHKTKTHRVIVIMTIYEYTENQMIGTEEGCLMQVIAQRQDAIIKPFCMEKDAFLRVYERVR